MGIGLGIFLIIAGAISKFAIKTSVHGVDLGTIGYILMGAGVLTLILSAAFFMPRTRRSRSAVVTTDAYGRQAITERDDRISGV